MICVQKVLLQCHSMQPPPHVCTHAHAHFPASPSSLTGSWFCKAAFCFVSCFPAFAHVSLTDAISLFCRQGALLPLKVALLFIPLHHPHHHGKCPESSLPFYFKGQTSAYTIARLLILIHNHMPFLSNRDLFCSSLCLTDTCKLFVDLFCQLSLLGLRTVRVSGSVCFLQLLSSPSQRCRQIYLWGLYCQQKWTSNVVRSINNSLVVSSKKYI